MVWRVFDRLLLLLLYQGLYQFLRAPSFPSNHPRSSPISMDYAKFGSGASTVVIPDDPGARFVSESLVMHFSLLPIHSTLHVLPLLWSPLSVPKHYLQFVGGKACKSVSGGSVAVQSPGGSGVLGYCPESGRKDVRNAVEAASKVQPGWDRHTTALWFNKKSVILKIHILLIWTKTCM